MVNVGKEVHEGAEVSVRSTPVPRLTVDASYSHLDRALTYEFANVPTVSEINTSILILPTLPRNKLVATASVLLPRHVSGIISARYEGGITLQDTTYATSSPLFQPFSESFATLDLGAIVPVYRRTRVQMGIKNVFDRNYYYTTGYPEEGRSWFLNLRCQF
jgi:iron complex outermembrane receptor protein